MFKLDARTIKVTNTLCLVVSRVEKIVRHAGAELPPSRETWPLAQLSRLGGNSAALGKRIFVTHPLLEDDAAEIRATIRQLINCAKWRRHSNIIFVCGGNTDNHMRTQFVRFASDQLPQYQLIKPEDAIRDNVGAAPARYIDLGKFEALIADLSHCVIIFPEAEGSYTELGMFSAKDEISKKTLVAIDLKYQVGDSFISQGPVSKYNDVSDFKPCVYIDYETPNFELIKRRLGDRGDPRLNKRRFKHSFSTWNETGNFLKLSVIYAIIDLTRFINLDALGRILFSIFRTRPPQQEVVDLVSILIGSGFCRYINDRELLAAAERSSDFVQYSTITEEIELKAEINSYYYETGSFQDLFEEEAA
ncbi:MULTISPECIES: retron St85 family effector protein [Kordiimonas]|uniref:retron St85 family effector protein n=1 Tax=Kordiimonas TaxID=288021 RepID=UPI002579972C|nr:retron St85 family effector protein [Kordiimonas sp. UBA4487]